MAISHAMQKYYEGELILEKFKSGEIDAVKLQAFINHAKSQAQFLAIEVAIQKTYAQFESSRKFLRNSGFVSTESIPNQTGIESVFPCPEQGDSNITRLNCLDYSGHPDHHDRCKQCERYNTSRIQATRAFGI